MQAVLETINIAVSAGAAMQAVESAMAVAGLGLEGDRYFLQRGTFTGRMQVAAGARELSIIDASAAQQCSKRLEQAVSATDLRRNLVIIGLDELLTGQQVKGCRLQIGDVIIRIVNTCPPCGYLSRLLAADMRTGLKNIGGYRAAIEQAGMLSIAATVTRL